VGAAGLLLGDPGAHRIGHRARQGRDGGVVEVEAVLADRELGKPAGEVDGHGSKYSFLQGRRGAREVLVPTGDEMCGIAGFAGGREEGGSDLVGRMLAALVHRGPDAAGVRTGEAWGLGARRLAIIDLVTGDQPVSNERGDVHAVPTGDLQLRRAAAELARGHRLRSTGDTGCCPGRKRAEMVGRLRGMFALAVADELAGRSSSPAPGGQKPLY
jgi:hypothetical protein